MLKWCSVKNSVQLSVGYDLRWPCKMLNASRPVGTSESRSADSIFQSHPVKNDDSEVFPHQPWRQNNTMRVLYLPSVQACVFLNISQYAQMEVLVQYVRGSIPQCNFCRSDKKSLAKCHESCLLATWWQKMLYAIIYVTQMKGDQNLFHCSGTTFRCLCRRWCWEVCTLRWSLVQIEICVSVSGLQRVMDGWIDSSNTLNKRCMVLSSHRLSAKAKSQLEKPLTEYELGDELTGVFIYFSPVSVQLGSVLRVKTTHESASSFHFNDRWSKSSKTQ